MRKVFIVLMFLTTIVSCKKDDTSSNNNNNNIPTDGWRIGSTAISYSSCVRSGSTSLKAYSTNGNLFITFASLPTASGTYSIVSNSSTPTAGQLSFQCSEGTDTYKSVLTTATTATVNVTSSIITVTIPEVDMTSLATGSTVKFAATVKEK